MSHTKAISSLIDDDNVNLYFDSEMGESDNLKLVFDIQDNLEDEDSIDRLGLEVDVMYFQEQLNEAIFAKLHAAGNDYDLAEEFAERGW